MATGKKTIYGLDASKYPARLGQPWSSDETAKLLKSIKDNQSLEDIAKDHQRTEGGITSYLRKMAYDYYKNDKKSIEEIVSLTGLSALVINKTITAQDGIQAKKTEKKEIAPSPVFNVEAEIKAIKADMAVMKKDIKEILECMKAVYEFETAESF